MQIEIDDLRGPEIAALLSEHLRDMLATSPPESVHALDLDRLRQPEITFWTIRDGEHLAGCGALKQLDNRSGEIKSMRVAHGYRRQGVAARLLQHIIAEARARQYVSLHLETGSMAFFTPAHQLYARFGFQRGGPFAGYTEDPNSIFMHLTL